MRKLFLPLLCVVCIPLMAQQKTYCNPLNVDYTYTPIAEHTAWGKHRSAAHPVIVNYKGDYYLFATNQSGYWWSPDLVNWNFVLHSFLPPELLESVTQNWQDLYAPAVWVQGDSLCVFGSAQANVFPIWISTNPKENEWRRAVERFEPGGWDPAFFADDDNRLYMYSSDENNAQLIYGMELHRKTFQPVGTRKELVKPDGQKTGSHHAGEYKNNTAFNPIIEGAGMAKHNGKYYLQWSTPGITFPDYGNAVATSTHPLGPFEQASLPLSMKPGGFIRGAGSGAAFRDHWENYWHVSTMVINVKNNFECRAGIWPAGFDEDGTMYCNTAFGDYPHYLPDGEANHRESRFTGWMLLNYNKPVQVSSTFGAHAANNLVDEDIKTYWSAATGDRGEWFISDLGGMSTVRAVQINYADQDAGFVGKPLSSHQEYVVSYSSDGKKWRVLFSKSGNKKDIPHDYIELEKPVETRYIKVENLAVSTGKFAVSGFRIFGSGHGNKPEAVSQFTAFRDAAARHNGWLKWQPVDDAYAYNIYIGENPDKLYNCVMVYGANEYQYEGMDTAKPYYFSIEAINENGTSDWVRADAL
ncbi:MAG: family 43 glycosylhydrolase [Prevotellaceae bacterium]|jgi:hypothetical protein|nr:family 43 glycosylhydrolase [Prevotellaceae bacterium]